MCYATTMLEKAPVLDVFLGREHDAWRLHFAPSSWCPGLRQIQLDQHYTIFPVSCPDVDRLERFMWERDAPYEYRKTKHGDLEILAKGRSALSLFAWLNELVRSASTATRERVGKNAQ
jgi:hypothetical protein